MRQAPAVKDLKQLALSHGRTTVLVPGSSMLEDVPPDADLERDAPFSSSRLARQ